MELGERIGVYVTFNGLPVFSLTNIANRDETVLMSGFLHAIDSFAMHSRENIERSSDFYGFAFVNEIEVRVMEVADENGKSYRDQGRLFVETPFSKISSNKLPISILLEVTRDTILKITNKELNLSNHPQKIADYFTDRLKDKGYTTDKLIAELSRLKASKSHFSGYMPITLFLIKEEKGSPQKVEEIGIYNKMKIKFNPVKKEEEKFTSELPLLINVVGALKAYQETANLKKGAILLRFKDYVLEVTYKKDGSPIVGVLVKGKGLPEEVHGYRSDIRKLESE